MFLPAAPHKLLLLSLQMFTLSLHIVSMLCQESNANLLDTSSLLLFLTIMAVDRMILPMLSDLHNL